MDPSRHDRPDRILDDWANVAHEARRPAIPPRRVTIRSGLPGTSILGAGLVAAALVVAVAWLGGRGPLTGVGGDPSASPVATPVATAHSSPTPATVTSAPTAALTARPTVAPTPSAAATTGPCRAADLHAFIIRWEGAAGQRIANLAMTYSGTSPCTLRAMARPQLVDRSGSILISGPTPSSSATLILAPSDAVTTLVQAGNYCGRTPDPPVTVAFVSSDGERIIATPTALTDATVPPCNGPGQPSVISMHPWTPR